MTGRACPTGTAMASPDAVGAAAVYLSSHAMATPTEARDALVAASTRGVSCDTALLGLPRHILFTGP